MDAKESNAISGGPIARPKRGRRFIVMMVVPLALVAGGISIWMTGGRYVSTDNAYVRQNKVLISAEVSGRIIEAEVKENQRVNALQPLLRIDPEPFKLAVRQAEAALSAARIQIEQLRSAYAETAAQLRAAEQDLIFLQREAERQKTLTARGFTTEAKFDDIQRQTKAAEQKVAIVRQSSLSAAAALGGDPAAEIDQHPRVQQAQAQYDQALLNLQHTTISAPAAGTVSQTDKLQVGQFVTAGMAILGLVEAAPGWIEANFKETDLTYMRPGQHATIIFDAFPDQELTAVVDSIGAATGAEFALLPAQNATGNWVKVVQRVPVRLRLLGPPAEVSLRSGMSAQVEIDTGHARHLVDLAPRMIARWFGAPASSQEEAVAR